MTPERPMRLALAIVGTAAIALSTAAAVLADSPGPASAPPESPASGGSAVPGSGPNSIAIIQKTFQPTSLTVHTGDTVTWTVTQAISDPHSVTSGSYKDTATAGKVFDSGIKLKANGDSFSFTFTTAGTFPFFCEVHPDTMSGTITVVDAGGATGGTAGEASGEGPIPTSSKVIAAAILVLVLLALFGWARLYQRMNRA